MAGLRQLHKADPVGRGYTVVGFGSLCVPQMLALALSIHDAAAALNATTASGGGGRTSGGGGMRWRVQVGVARGNIATGGLGARRQRCHFFGGAVAAAVQLARECSAGETRVQRGVSKAEGAQDFTFTHALGGGSGSALAGLEPADAWCCSACGQRTLPRPRSACRRAAVLCGSDAVAWRLAWRAWGLAGIRDRGMARAAKRACCGCLLLRRAMDAQLSQCWSAASGPNSAAVLNICGPASRYPWRTRKPRLQHS